jgi:NTP pyrophosphatase (non-canonical NTP hydrolase)
MDLKQIQEKTVTISKRFPNGYSKENRLVDLVEEVGELAQAMLIVDKLKTTNDPTKQKTVHDIADALADVLYNLLLLADDYGVDLDQEYQDMIWRLEKRLDEGEFKR